VIGIVIVAHCGLAKEYLAAVEHVVGKQKNIRTIEIENECNRSGKEADIHAAVDAVDKGDGVVVVTDMFGGSPSNLSLGVCCKKNRKILYGANLPMLVKLVKSRHLPIDNAVSASLKAGRKYIDCYE
jgi:PTS system mannose-specific IIA component